MNKEKLLKDFINENRNLTNRELVEKIKEENQKGIIFSNSEGVIPTSCFACGTFEDCYID